jgi:NAD(P)-dependent dehydrogenase (short-subunit alcohol dehydrogenase family)
VSDRALVTGASRGLGRAVALELARRGFDVVATMRTPDDALGLEGAADDLPGSLRVARLDVTDPATIEISEGTTVVVNNAAVEQEPLPLEHTDVETWRRVFETNVFGVAEVIRRAIPVLRSAGGGVIVNVTSSVVLRPVPFEAAYRASKAALSAMTETLQSELAGSGIRLVEIMPGPVETDMLAANDDGPGPARVYPQYRAMAEMMWDRRNAHRDLYTPADVAAAFVVDAIVDDGAPLRNGCDPVSTQVIASWAETNGAVWSRRSFEAFLAAEPRRPRWLQ